MLYVYFLTRLLHIVSQAKQLKLETTTDQRNSSIIGRDKIYISSKKREEMQFIYLIHPANSNSHEISGILTRFPCFMSIF